MTADEFDQAVLERRKRKPFQAYTIDLVGGERIDIDRSHTVAIRNGVTTCFAGGKIDLETRSENVSRMRDMPIGGRSSQELI